MKQEGSLFFAAVYPGKSREDKYNENSFGHYHGRRFNFVLLVHLFILLAQLAFIDSRSIRAGRACRLTLFIHLAHKPL